MRVYTSCVLLAAVAAWSGCAGRAPEFDARPVLATAQTVPMPNANDAADDPAIWVNAANPGQSLVIGTNKQEGLGVYTLDGALLHYYAFGKPNNVDVAYGFPIAGANVDIVATEDRSIFNLRLFAVEPADRSLREIPVTSPRFDFEPYGSGLYKAQDGRFFVFIGSKSGVVRQYLLATKADGSVALELVRMLTMPSQVEGIVADAELGRVYIGEERAGIWRFGANPEDGTTGTLIAPIGAAHPIRRPDLEGLTIYRTGATSGYLIASSQGSNEYVILRRDGENEFVGVFKVTDGPAIGGTEETDGIDVTSAALGTAFPHGLFVAQDGHNQPANQNFKLVPWEAIASQFEPALDLAPRTAE